MSDDQQSCSDPSTETKGEIISARRYALDFAVRRSIRYHNKRRRFFSHLRYLTVFFTAIASSAAFAALSAESHALATVLTGCIAVISFLDLAIDFVGKSALHDGLQKRFSSLLIKVGNKSGDMQALNELETERLLIEQDEPGSLKALDILCHNEEVTAQDNGTIYYIAWWHLPFINIISFDGWMPRRVG